MAEPQLAELPWDQRKAAATELARTLVDKATKLRGVPLPDEHAMLPEVHKTLVKVRAALDQLEMLYAQAMAVKHYAEAAAVDAERKAQDSWDDQAEAARKRGIAQYEGAQERYAWFRVKTRTELSQARIARDIADQAAMTERAIQLLHRGLDGTRLDLHRRMNAAAVMESSMERT